MGAQDGISGEGTHEVRIGPHALPALACLPPQALGWVAFAPGFDRGGSDQRVAGMLQARGLGTLLLQLPPVGEAAVGPLAEHLLMALEWLEAQGGAGAWPVGLFGAGAGGTAVLRVASERPQRVAAVVACGSRPDLAPLRPGRLAAPTLLVAGGLDGMVLRAIREALPLLAGERRLEVVPGATHRFDEPGALETLGHLAADWFAHHQP